MFKLLYFPTDQRVFVLGDIAREFLSFLPVAVEIARDSIMRNSHEVKNKDRGLEKFDM